MREAQAAVHLAEYSPWPWKVDAVSLRFVLSPGDTRVHSRIAFSPRPGLAGPFRLDGEHLTLIAARIDGKPVTPCVNPGGLTCDVPDKPFVWECEVRIDPAANTALSGLYMSNGMYCTQC
ncbi:aminopeptidase N [Oceaniovalibus guishaninsula JLT2003]|uniref:Aminopeptidase N n=1 Tax=Oceaniovalibus guishaninsula JLT2003 TaxID=1231392 RepID=K2GSC3_9RHOB|nr:aminopeptidase N [Oceaniovalibus guishaninsula JLT2003]